jgi:hypothetical protein
LVAAAAAARTALVDTIDILRADGVPLRGLEAAPAEGVLERHVGFHAGSPGR